MLQRLISVFAGAFMLAGAAMAQTPAPAAAETATPAMWRAADADTEVFLLGSFHILPPELQWRTDALDDAFAAADIVYFEVDVDAPDAQSKAVKTMMTQGFNPAGVTLSGMLKPADAQKLREITASLGLPFSAIDPMRPWQAFLTLSVQFIIKQGFTPGAGVDSALLAEARALDKEARFFETIEQQLEFFTGLAPETEEALLVLTIRGWEEQAKSFDDLFAAWRTGDVDFVDEQMNELMREQAPVVYKRLIVERNAAWAEEIARAMNEEAGVIFIAVGAAHLVGPDHSVPALLEAEGFEVSRYGEAAANEQPAPESEDEIGELLEELEE